MLQGVNAEVFTPFLLPKPWRLYSLMLELELFLPLLLPPPQVSFKERLREQFKEQFQFQHQGIGPAKRPTGKSSYRPLLLYTVSCT